MGFAPSACNGEVPLVSVVLPWCPWALSPRSQASPVLRHHHAMTEMPGITPSSAAPFPPALGGPRPHAWVANERSGIQQGQESGCHLTCGHFFHHLVVGCG